MYLFWGGGGISKLKKNFAEKQGKFKTVRSQQTVFKVGKQCVEKAFLILWEFCSAGIVKSSN